MSSLSAFLSAFLDARSDRRVSPTLLSRAADHLGHRKQVNSRRGDAPSAYVHPNPATSEYSFNSGENKSDTSKQRAGGTRAGSSDVVTIGTSPLALLPIPLQHESRPIIRIAPARIAAAGRNCDGPSSPEYSRFISLAVISRT